MKTNRSKPWIKCSYVSYALAGALTIVMSLVIINWFWYSFLPVEYVAVFEVPTEYQQAVATAELVSEEAFASAVPNTIDSNIRLEKAVRCSSDAQVVQCRIYLRNRSFEVPFKDIELEKELSGSENFFGTPFFFSLAFDSIASDGSSIVARGSRKDLSLKSILPLGLYILIISIVGFGLFQFLVCKLLKRSGIIRIEKV